MLSLSVLLQRSHKKEKIPVMFVVPNKRTIDSCEKFSNDRFIAGQKRKKLTASLVNAWFMLSKNISSEHNRY